MSPPHHGPAALSLDAVSWGNGILQAVLSLGWSVGAFLSGCLGFGHIKGDVLLAAITLRMNERSDTASQRFRETRFG